MADAGDALWFGGFRGLRDSVNQGAGKRFFFFSSKVCLLCLTQAYEFEGFRELQVLTGRWIFPATRIRLETFCTCRVIFLSRQL